MNSVPPPPKENAYLGALSALLLKPEVKNLWYNGSEVKLDGYKFVSCRFDHCTLVITSPNFELHSCFISDDTVVRFGSEIAKPIRLFNLRHNLVYDSMPFFAPIKNADGTITVAG